MHRNIFHVNPSNESESLLTCKRKALLEKILLGILFEFYFQFPLWKIHECRVHKMLLRFSSKRLQFLWHNKAQIQEVNLMLEISFFELPTSLKKDARKLCDNAFMDAEGSSP